jgi:hypothetical protein
MDDDLLHELGFVSGKEYKACEMEGIEKRVAPKTSTDGIAIETWAQ